MVAPKYAVMSSFSVLVGSKLIMINGPSTFTSITCDLSVVFNETGSFICTFKDVLHRVLILLLLCNL